MKSWKRAYITCQICGWSAHCLLNLALMWFSMGAIRWPITLAIVWAEAVAAMSSHLLRAWILRHGWLDLSLIRAFPRIFGASVACGASITAVTSATSVLFHLNRRPDWNWLNVIPIFLVWSVVIFLWSVIYFGVSYFERYRDSQFQQMRLAVAAKDSELRALLAQVNPHFLFNCLNSLRALTVEDPLRAQEMIDQLSRLLRYSLQSGRSQTVSFESEVEAIRAYLNLESMRFEERLRVEIDVDPLSRAIPIPPMLVQTLVENGVKHGVARIAQGGEIRLISRVEEGGLKIQVINTGRLASERNGSTEIGLTNARERLRILYGSAASLILRNSGTDQVLAEVWVPLQRAVP